jgi:Ca-activated chloride channel family protein
MRPLPLALVSLAVIPVIAAAPVAASVGTVKVNDVQHGSLLLKDPTQTDPNAYVEAPLLETDVQLDVTGLIVRAEVRQRFANPTKDFVEGTYVFPLSDTAAVDTLRIVIGPRIIEGRIEEKKKAAEIYAKAKAEGKIASLVEQAKPNLFTTKVANIPAGEKIDVIIGYQDTLAIDSGRVSLRFPLAVTPLYTPASAPSAVGSFATTKFTNKPGPVAIDVLVDAGFPIAGARSPSHAIDVTREGERVFHAGLAQGRESANRDFVLEWDALPLTAPRSSITLEPFAGETYGLVMIAPPTVVDEATRVPCDTTFIIDTSGSMAGPSMDDAKKALMAAIAKLPQGDRFNVIDFDDVTRPLWPAVKPATRANVEEAARVIDGYEADGGTMMLPALQLALADKAASGRVKQVIFMTDGAVSNEVELFDTIKRALGAARLFTVGIGAAPNAYFMRKAAEMGRGTFTFIAKPEDVGPKMSELFAKVQSPVLTNLELVFAGVASDAVDVWPKKLPDLFVGEPLMFVTRTKGAPKSVVLKGVSAGAPVSMTLAMTGAQGTARDKGVHKLWARKKVDSLTDARNTGGDTFLLEKDILTTALTHGIVSDFTSLIAVDVTPVRKSDEKLGELSVPTALPEGMMPKGGTSGPGSLLLGALLTLAAAILISRERERA